MGDMKALITILLVTLTPPTIGQTVNTLIATPSGDASIGYHDGYPTANTNYNSSIHYSGFYQPGTSGGVNYGRGLMQFDLSAIPAGSNVIAAYLHLTGIGPFAATGLVTSVGNVGQNACTLRRITGAWNASTVTWNTQPSTSNTNEVLLAQSTYVTQNYLNVDVTALAQDMVNDPVNSHGFEIRLVTEALSRGLAFHSSEAPEPYKWPVLIVIYGDCEGSGMTEIGSMAEFSLFPNLTYAGATISLGLEGVTKEAVEAELINSLGMVAARVMLGAKPRSLQIPNIAIGTYTVLLRDRNGMGLATSRLVVN